MTGTKRIVIKTVEQAHAYLDSIGLDPTVVEHDGGVFVVETKNCRRCGGSGTYSGYHGVCFDCRNVSSRRSWTVKTPIVEYARKARQRELAAARKAKKAAERAAVRAERLLEGQRDWCEKNTPYGRVTFEERDELAKADRDKQLAEAVQTMQHVGVVGERQSFELTLDKAIFIERSDRYLHIFSDSAGNRLVYWSDNRLLARSLHPDLVLLGVKSEMPEGYRFTCTAQVRRHDDYTPRGGSVPVPQTTLFRPAAVKPAVDMLWEAQLAAEEGEAA